MDDLLQRVVLLGAGGHASDILTIFEANKRLFGTDVDLAIADDKWDAPLRFEARIPYLRVDGINSLALDRPFVVAIGYPAPRKSVAERASHLGGVPAPSLVHPASEVGAGSELGEGTVVLGLTWISPRVLVGDHAYLGYGATIGHDTAIGNYSSIMPGSTIGGEVQIGESVLVGANSTILQGLHVGDSAIIGAGAVVTSDVEAGQTVAGVPARRL